MMPLQIYQPLDDQGLEVILFLGYHEYLGFVSRLSPLLIGALAALAVSEPACVRSITE
jgi:hypothetical protein